MPIKGIHEGAQYDGKAQQLTPEWWEMVRFSMEEADRLGLKLGMHICDGFQCCDLRHTIRKISRKPRNAGTDNQVHLLVFGISHHALKRIPFPQ